MPKTQKKRMRKIIDREKKNVNELRAMLLDGEFKNERQEELVTKGRDKIIDGINDLEDAVNIARSEI